MGTRRKGREIALQILYELEVLAHAQASKKEETKADLTSAMAEMSPGTVNEAIEGFFKHFEGATQVFGHASSLVRGTLLNLKRIDSTIQKHSEKWRLERMSKVDRNLLRLATYELLFSHDLPSSIVLDEAIEIAKRYGNEKSGAFINGVLDSIVAVKKK